MNCFKIKYIPSFHSIKKYNLQNCEKEIGCLANKLLKEKKINWQDNCNVDMQSQKDHAVPEQRSFNFSLKGTW